MNVKKFSEAMGEISLSHVERALAYRPAQKRHLIRWMAAAACLVLLIAASLILPHRSITPRPGDSEGEGEMALETTYLDIYYVSEDDTIQSENMEVACAPNDIFGEWAVLNNISDVSLVDSVYDSDGTQTPPEHEGETEAEDPAEYTIGTHFTLTLTLSSEFSRYQEGERGALLVEALQKTFAGYLDFDEFILVVED